MKTILFFNISDQNKMKYNSSLDKDIRSIYLQEEDCHQKVGYLHQIEGFEKIDVNDDCDLSFVDKEMMMVSGFSKEEIFDLVQFFKERNWKRPVTCALTETNQDWSFYELLQEVFEEDKIMKGR